MKTQGLILFIVLTLIALGWVQSNTTAASPYRLSTPPLTRMPLLNKNAQNNKGNSLTCDPPIAGFIVSSHSVFVGETVVFTNATMGTVTLYSWDFGDGEGMTTTLDIINHTYVAASSYTVTLEALNDCGSDWASTVITVNEPLSTPTPTPTTCDPPIAGFIVSSHSVFVGETVVFTNATMGTVTLYSWDFGDGEGMTTTLDIINHTYVAASSYTVTLEALSDCGLDRASTVITVNEPLDQFSYLPIVVRNYPPTPTPTPGTPTPTPTLGTPTPTPTTPTPWQPKQGRWVISQNGHLRGGSFYVTSNGVEHWYGLIYPQGSSTCSFNFDIAGPFTISNRSFSFSEWQGQFTGSGNFTSETTASGNMSFSHTPTTCLGVYYTGSMSWIATWASP